MDDMRDDYAPDAHAGDFSREWQQAKTWKESQLFARLLGQCVRTPATMGELLQAGVDSPDAPSEGLRQAFIALRDAYLRTGRAAATDLETHLEIVLPEAAMASVVVDFILKQPSVRSLDDIGTLLQHVRERVARRRFGRLMLHVGDRGDDTPLQELISNTRRELEDIETLASLRKDGLDGPDLAAQLQAQAEGAVRTEVIPTGLPNVDAALRGGLRVGTINLLIAGTGTGKTTYGMHVAAHVAILRALLLRRPTLYICLEDPHQATRTLAQLVAGHRLPIPATAAPAVWTDVALARGLVEASPMKLLTQQPLTAEAVMSKVRAFKRRLPILGTGDARPLVIIDYVQRIRKSTRWNSVGDVEHISETLRLGALEEQVAVLMLSQVSADGRKRLAEKNAGPLTAEDSAGGVQYANDSAAVITVERKRDERDEKKRNVSTVRIVKNRDFGEAAEGFMRWDPASTRLTPCERDGGPVDRMMVDETEQSELFDSYADEASGATVLPFPGGGRDA
jgi:replicative DNA helicase